MRPVGYPKSLSANLKHDAAIRAVTQEAVEFLHTQVGELPGLRAIVLTGAPARGEGTAMTVRNRVVVLSDIDLVLVFATAHDATRSRERLIRGSAAANEALRARGLTSHVDYGTATPESLASLGQSMYAYELATYGHVLEGDASVLDSVQRVEPAGIPREDALWLLMNRSAGQLALRPDIVAGSPELMLFAAYHSAKVACDVVGALVCYHGLYRPTYSSRMDALRVAVDQGISPRVSSEVLGAAKRWTAFKLDPDQDEIAPILARMDDEARRAALSLWDDARRWLTDAWRSLGGHYVGLDPQAAPGRVVRGLASKESLARRLRMWASLMKHPFVEHRRLKPLAVGRNLLRASPGLGASLGVMLVMQEAWKEAASYTCVRPKTPAASQIGFDGEIQASLLEVWRLVMKGGAA